MRLGDFLDELLLHRALIINNITNMGWCWSERKRYAELTSMIDFKCNFDEDGICEQYQYKKHYKSGRRKAKETIERVSKCCCRSCGDYIGYLDSLPNSRYDLELIASRFNKKTGFWRLGEGCVLPREYRSNTCLFYMCNHSQFKKNSTLFLLRSIMTTPWVSKPSTYTRIIISSPPKMITKYHSGKRRSWISYDKMERMIIKEYGKRVHK